MVVLESHSHPSHHTHSHSMASTGGGGGGINEYNIPLYPGNISPTMLDSKKSPLAMLVATCSQIGADPCHPSSNSVHSSSKFSKKLQPPSPNEPNNNHHHASQPKNHRSSRSPTDPHNKSSSSSSSSPTLSMTKLTTPTPSQNKSPSPTHLAIQSQLPTKLKSDPQPESSSSSQKKSSHAQKRPRSTTSSTASTISPIPPPPKSARSSSQTPPTTSAPAPPPTSVSAVAERDNSNCIASPTPTIRSGMEVLHGNHRYPPMGHQGHMSQMAAAAAAGYYYPGMMDPTTAMFLLQNPAFRDLRLPFPVGGGGGSPYGAGASSPYLSPYYRPPGGKSECKDPYCTGCPPPTAPQVQGICPAGCASCDHQKVPYPQFYHPSAPQAQPQSQSHSPTNGGPGGQPHICNWIVGDNYCGKRFTSSEELLTHLRSHTSAAQASAAAAAENSASALALQQHLAASSLYSGAHHPAFLGGPGGQQGQLAAMAMQQMQAQMRGFSQFGMNPYAQQGAGGGSKLGGQGFSLPPGYYPPPNPYAGLFPSRPV